MIPRKTFLVCIICGAVGVDLASFAQENLPNRFDITSVKPHDSQIRPTVVMRSGSLTMAGLTFKQFLVTAFHLQPFRISGLPAWADSDRFDLEGIFQQDKPGSLEITEPQRAKLLEALKLLLKDRFGLEYQLEKRTMQVFYLKIAKGGPKIKTGEELPPNPPDGRADGSVVRLVRRSSNMSELAYLLSGLLGYDVLDQTGLVGSYSFSVVLPQNATALNGDESVSGLTASLREQLGLTLESGKDSVEVLVTNKVHKPTQN